MLTLTTVAIGFTGLAIVLCLLVASQPELTRTGAGKVVAFVALFLFPAAASWTGLSAQLEESKATPFCLSCHVMSDYGHSLYIDDPTYLPAAHFQNNRIPREQACYTCHTTYTLYGPVQAKLRGLRHLYVQYLGTVPNPAEIRLYSPFSNRECLHCHSGGRSFEEGATHQDFLAEIKSGARSCISSGCHESVHDVAKLNEQSFWKEAQ
jgi:NapC/NirT cytochrome c family protein